MNSVLIGISDAYVNAYSVIAYAGSLFASLMYGLSTGLQPLFGLSYGANSDAIKVASYALPKYCLNYIFAAVSAVIASYLFSTKRTQYAISLNVCRSIIFNFICIMFLPLIFGDGFVWYTIAVAEAVCLVIALILWKYSERKGVIYK